MTGAGRHLPLRRALAATMAAAGAMLVGATPAVAELAPPPVAAIDPKPADDWPRPTPDEVAASHWVLVEGATGQRLAEHRADEQRAVASTIKVLTALTAIGRVDLDDEVTVGEEVLVGGASVGLEPGETWSVQQLLEAILVRSGNDAAEALATHVAGTTEDFLELMEADAQALGLPPRGFGSPSGLGDTNELSAYELATIARAALADDRLRPILAQEQTELPGQGTVENRNELLGSYPGASGVKTGFTLAAGNSLVASAQRDGRELIAVVLDAGDDPARFAQAARLLDLGFSAFRAQELALELELSVAGGRRAFVLEPAPLTIPTDAVHELVVDLPARVPEGPIAVAVEVDGTPVAMTQAEAVDHHASTTAASAADLGAALADGAYATLRAAAAAGSLR
ncbi:D-alanyl-D-alanine carboxypeptidase family protein [Egicoccus sp. AB-alg6-2]|uniref:D-alanyl-D-alanine carboxypeptidase family protein n=1 Tax=Egicoccus sp. AB-alg6-2 TaxID=3242692 RepID=UPI00359D2689